MVSSQGRKHHPDTRCTEPQPLEVVHTAPTITPTPSAWGKTPPPEGGKQDVTCDISDDGDNHCSHVLRPHFEPDTLECILHVLSHVKSSEGVVTGREVRQEQDPPRFSDAPGQLLPPCVLVFLSCQTNTPWPRVKWAYFNHNEQRVCSSVLRSG